MQTYKLLGHVPEGANLPPTPPIKLLEDCKTLEAFYVFAEYDSRDAYELEVAPDVDYDGTSLLPDEKLAIVGFWDPEDGNIGPDVQDFIEAGGIVSERAGPEWAEEPNAYIYGVVFARGKWRRFYLVSLSLRVTFH